jgi:hypothetical protein
VKPDSSQVGFEAMQIKTAGCSTAAEAISANMMRMVAALIITRVSNASSHQQQFTHFHYSI